MFSRLADSYKYSHYLQYPPSTTHLYSYFESRGGLYPKVVMFGLQHYLTYFSHASFSQGITLYNDLKRHGLPCNAQGFKYIYNSLKDNVYRLPLEIRALPEGTVVPTGVPLFTVTNTDPKCAWLVPFVETYLMKLWYSITIATKSYYVRKMLSAHETKTSDNPTWIDFAYHNFGDRGSCTIEQAVVGGEAHLTQFLGTDNFCALQGPYDATGFSIPATEHSTVTSWGRENEFAFYDHFLETFKSYPMIASVMDSYDIYEAVGYITSGKFKEKVESSDYPTFVIRPDSGNPSFVIGHILGLMSKNNVSYKINSKGYIVFDKYRILWGDGITPEVIDSILEGTTKLGFSCDNFAFGSGGDLMQNCTRDTNRFAMKVSHIRGEGFERDVFKDPITDPGKTSKKGRITTAFDGERYFVAPEGHPQDAMRTVFKDGEYFNIDDFETIRQRSRV